MHVVADASKRNIFVFELEVALRAQKYGGSAGEQLLSGYDSFRNFEPRQVRGQTEEIMPANLREWAKSIDIERGRMIEDWYHEYILYQMRHKASSSTCQTNAFIPH